MPSAERIGASRCGVYPNGIWFDESAEWHESDLQPYLSVIDRAVANMAAAEFGGFRQRFMAGTNQATMPSLTKEQLELYYGVGVKPDAQGNWAVELPVNERSKPVGLTKEYVYTDEDGDTIHVHKIEEEPHAVIGIKDGDYAYVQPEYSVPLALNVLGYDRPGTADFTLTSAVVVRGDGHRDDVLAHAVASLRAIDLYDQWADTRKAEEEAAAKAARAKVAEREIAERFLRKTKSAYSEAIADQFWVGINAESVAKVQAALSAYETARRKVEGLPN